MRKNITFNCKHLHKIKKSEKQNNKTASLLEHQHNIKYQQIYHQSIIKTQFYIKNLAKGF